MDDWNMMDMITKSNWDDSNGRKLDNWLLMYRLKKSDMENGRDEKRIPTKDLANERLKYLIRTNRGPMIEDLGRNLSNKYSI